ncbi:MAG: hypothetical protein K2Y37_02065 [Pirellulales bacterium]|nr:hypothetical protein [Pirellulales bacterium]
MAIRSIVTRCGVIAGISLVLFVAAKSSVGQSVPRAASARVSATKARGATWQIRETVNFRVCSAGDRESAERLAARCEELREHLSGVWLNKRPVAAWKVRCQIVVHATDRQYERAVGRGAESTVGSALIETEASKIVTRKIDLRPDRGTETQTALAHELTHIIIADRIDRSQLPPWADEGIAVLADCPAKQAAHFDDLRRGLDGDAAFRIGELFTLSHYPAPERMGVFYGQSASLASFLVARGTPCEFVRFLELAAVEGYDSALSSVYSIGDVGQLERLWRKSLKGRDANFARQLPGKLWELALADQAAN